jgi:transposase-like protein
MEKTPIFIETVIKKVSYVCPHCKERISYETDGIPKPQCHRCLKKLKWAIVSK